MRQEQVVWINLTGASQRVSFKKGYPFEGSDSVFAVAPYKPSRKYTIRSDAKKNYEYEYSVMPLQNMSGPQAPEVIIDD